MQRRWSWATFEALRPHVDALFAASTTLIPARSRELGDWVAMLAVDADESGLTLLQLQRFVQYASNEARRVFADSVPRHLERLTSDARRQVWRNLLQPYWRDRRTNMPTSLSKAEVREMISWIPALPEVAGEALVELRESPGDELQRADQLIWQWNEDDTWVRAHPTEAVEIVAFLGERRSINAWLVEQAITVLEGALEAGAERAEVLRAAETLVPLSPAAAAFVDQLRSGS
jgi:hypothetical protein